MITQEVRSPTFIHSTIHSVFQFSIIQSAQYWWWFWMAHE